MALPAGDTLESDLENPGEDSMSDFETVMVNEIPAGARLLDVREDYEWSAGHAEAAVHIPLEQLPARIDDLDPDEDLYVICRTGGRSFRAVQWLVGLGYSAFNVAGGMDQWLESGLPLVSDNGLKPAIL
jgi:rhodanese-related sulfurtransferase